MKNVLVIGAGPGGYVAAIRSAQLGASVTVVEKENVGGTCLNVGCIPTKCLLHTAEVMEELVSRGKDIGIVADNVSVDFARAIAHKDAVVTQLTGGVAALLKANGCEVIKGTASFTGPKTVSVAKADGTSAEFTPDAVIIAAGSVNAAPPVPGIADNSDCIDSTGALSLKEIPETLTVIGAGVIGLEIGCLYAAFGSKVTIVEMLKDVMPKMDRDIIRTGVAHMKRMGVEFNMGAKVTAVEKKDGKNIVKFIASNGSEKEVSADKVLVATGRRAFTKDLGLDRAGIDCERGAIIVDDHMRTNVPGIYAIGDCVKGYPQLAHTASVMGETAAENIMGEDVSFDPKTNPACLYIFPEAAGVGLTEEDCKTQGIEYHVGRFPLAANGKALIANGGEGIVKLIIGNKYGEVLGMHMIGSRASDIIAEGALAIGTEATADEIIGTIHSHPTVAEAVREAALASYGRAIHIQNRKR